MKHDNIVPKSSRHVQEPQKAAEHVTHKAYMKYIYLLTCCKFSLQIELNATFFKNKSTNDSAMMTTYIAANIINLLYTMTENHVGAISKQQMQRKRKDGEDSQLLKTE